jgi:hypothetical protein
VGDALYYNILTCDTHQVIQRTVVRSVEKFRSLDLEATFPIDEYNPVITVAVSDFPVELHSPNTDLDEGSSVGRTPFGDICEAATQDIIRC